MSDQEAIRDLIGRYLEAADRGREHDLAALFAPDGVLEIAEPSFDAGRYAGPDAIVARLERNRAELAARASVPLLRHHVSSVRIHLDGDTARADSYFLAVTGPGPDHWGRYRDDLVRDADEGGWRFAHRRVIIEGSVEGSFTRAAPPAA